MREWPWPKSGLVIIVLLSLMMLCLVALMHQQRYVHDLHCRDRKAQEDAIGRAHRNMARLCALGNVSHMMGTMTRLKSVFESVTETCLEAFDWTLASLMLFDEESQQLELRSAAGPAKVPPVVGAQVELGEGIAGWAAKHHPSLLITRDFLIER